jgi:hypothetical protein
MSLEYEFTQVLLSHLQLSLIPALLGALAGGGLGALSGRFLVKKQIRSPWLIRAGELLPWRALAFSLAFLGLVSPFLLLSFGIRSIMRMGMAYSQPPVGLAVGFLALFFTAAAVVNASLPGNPAGRWLAAVRTVVVAAYFLSLLYELGAGGAGFLMTRALNNLDYSAWQHGVLIVVGLAILTDLVFGLFFSWLGRGVQWA